jgi:hypothetical protein
MKTITGRVGGASSGYDIKLNWDGQTLQGRIGGTVDGKDIELITEAPLEVAALAAVVAFKVMQDKKNSDGV